jgi:hypothetical protein
MPLDAETQAAANADAGSEQADPKPGWKAGLVREVREHPFGYVVLAIFVLAGPVGAHFLFPQAPPAIAIVGGLAFGAYAALCAVPQKFI